MHIYYLDPVQPHNNRKKFQKKGQKKFKKKFRKKRPQKKLKKRSKTTWIVYMLLWG